MLAHIKRNQINEESDMEQMPFKSKQNIISVNLKKAQR